MQNIWTQREKQLRLKFSPHPMHITIPESTENWMITQISQGGVSVCIAAEGLPFPFLFMSSIMKCWVGMFLCLGPVQCFLLFLTFTLAFSFNYLDVVILGKAVPSIMVCSPSKTSLLPPYLCELIKMSSSDCSLPLFSISSPSQLTSLSLFSTTFQLSPQPLGPFGITSYFLFHFLLEKMFLDHSQKSLAWNHTHAGSVCPGHVSRDVSSACSPWPSHQVRPGFVNHVPYSQHSRQAPLRVTGLVGLAPFDNSSCFHVIFKKVCLRYENVDLFFLQQVKRDSSEGKECWVGNICPAEMCFSVCKCIIQLLFILYRSV